MRTLELTPPTLPGWVPWSREVDLSVPWLAHHGAGVVRYRPCTAGLLVGISPNARALRPQAWRAVDSRRRPHFSWTGLL